MYNAREILANYAKANKVVLRITPDKKNNSYMISAITSDTKRGSITSISKDENKIYEASPKQGKMNFEDNFLKHVYRTVTNMVAGLNK